jgi:hypothetical protein
MVYAPEQVPRGRAGKRNTIALVILATVLLPAVATAQRNVVIRDRARCSQCSIEIEQMADFGDLDGPGILSNMDVWTRDSRGLYYTMALFDPARIIVFDSLGNFVRTIGREGQGPGEFRSIRVVHADKGDSLHIVDEQNNRYSVLSPSYDLVRDFRPRGLVGITGSAFLPNGLAVINAMVRTADALVDPYHVYRSSGEHVRSFGYDSSVITVTQAIRQRRVLAPSQRPNVFWAAHVNRYVVEQWHVAGVRRLRIERRTGRWFRPYDEDPTAGAAPDNPPKPWITGLYEDAGGLLWTFTVVLDEDWEDALFQLDDEFHGAYYTWTRYGELFDTRVEVIDPVAGELIASRVVDPYLFTSDGLVMSLERDANDEVYMATAWRPVLIRGQ